MAGKSKLTADGAEQARLRALSKSAHRGEADRARAILLTLEGRRAGEIAAALGVHTSTVRNWRGYFAHGGVAGLRRRQRPGQQAKIGPHAGAIAAAILDEDARHDGGWTLRACAPRSPGAAGRRSRPVALAPIAPKGLSGRPRTAQGRLRVLNGGGDSGFVSGCSRRNMAAGPDGCPPPEAHRRPSANAHAFGTGFDGCRSDGRSIRSSAWTLGSGPVPVIPPHAACGAADAEDIALYGRSKQAWLTTFLALPERYSLARYVPAGSC